MARTSYQDTKLLVPQRLVPQRLASDRVQPWTPRDTFFSLDFLELNRKLAKKIVSRDYKNPQAEEAASIINEESENRERSDKVEDVYTILHCAVITHTCPVTPGCSRTFE